MKLCVIHTLSIWESLLGKLAEDARADETERTVAYAAEHAPLMIDALSHKFDRVLLAVDAGTSFRKHAGLEPSWIETQKPRPRAALVGYSAFVKACRDWCWAEQSSADCKTPTVVEAPAWPAAGAPFLDLGGGDALPLAGQRGAGRDVIASLWWWWCRSEHADDGVLRIVSTRSSLLSLEAGMPRVELVREVRSDGSFKVASGEALTTHGDPRWVADAAALALCGTWDRARTGATRSGLGDQVARALVAQHGGIEGTVALGLGPKPEGMSAQAHAVLVAAAADGGKLWRRAYALHALRADVPLDMVALLSSSTFKALAEPAPAADFFQPGEDSQARGERTAGPHGPTPPAVAAPSLSPATGCAGERAADGSSRAAKEQKPMTQNAPEIVTSPAAASVAPAPMVIHHEARSLTAPGDFGAEHMRIVREAFAPTASQAEFEVMWAGAKARRLDPVRKQIHFVKRKTKRDGQWVDVWTSIVGIDGFRAIAEQTGKYDGQDEPEFEYDDENRLCLARVRVWRKDISRPFVGVARWGEYVQTTADGNPTQTWQKMEHTMLAKCAEALAFRKAFPEPLAGLYTGDEMAQADNVSGPREMRQVLPPKPKAAGRPRTLGDRVAELAAGEDIAASRATLVREMNERNIDAARQTAALADFDARAGATQA